MFDEKISDLLDSGTSFTCIGGELAKKFIKSEKPYKIMKHSAKSTDAK